MRQTAGAPVFRRHPGARLLLLSVAACALLCRAQTAAPAPASNLSAAQRAAAAGTSEQTESGELHLSGGRTQSYRIRLLPVAAFPQTPSGVAAELVRRGCLIPQSFEAQGPENLIHGAFREAGSDDWAALCSQGGWTTLYVFFAGAYNAPVALRRQADTVWLGAEPGSAVCGSAWGIATRRLADLRASRSIERPAALDHDAIDDARLEQSVTVRYYTAGRWLVLSGAGPE